MIIKRSILENLLQQASFKSNGDVSEIIYGDLVVQWFPNCERFWKLFVIPFTNRMSGHPNTLSQDIYPRDDIDFALEDIANTHYSNFLNLIYAHMHFFTDSLSSLEDFYVHLGSVCDLTETFLEKCFFLLLTCRGSESETLQKLSREAFINLAGDWYDKNYNDLYEHYLSKGKGIPIHIPTRKSILKEFFQKYLKNSQLRKKYLNFSRPIREFRNIIVHDVQVGKLIIDGHPYLPKPEVIQKYRTWKKVFAAANDPDVIRRDFCFKKNQMYNDLYILETILNEIWDLIIKEFLFEFYSEERDILRKMYNLQLGNE